MSYRVIAAVAYASGLLEAKGLAETAAFFKTIPAGVDGGSSGGDGYDKWVNSLESLVAAGDTRFPPLILAIAVGIAANATWDAIKYVGKKISD
jgi:hypothetical protein